MSLVPNGICGTGETLMTVTNLSNEFGPYYEWKGTAGSRYMLWYDWAVIKLSYLFESIEHTGLTQKLDASLRLCLNTGTDITFSKSSYYKCAIQCNSFWKHIF